MRTRSGRWKMLAVLLESLTRREREVLGLLAQGRSNAEIAGELFLSETTVKTHVDEARRKLGARTRSQAAARLVQFGLA